MWLASCTQLAILLSGSQAAAKSQIHEPVFASFGRKDSGDSVKVAITTKELNSPCQGTPIVLPAY